MGQIDFDLWCKSLQEKGLVGSFSIKIGDSIEGAEILFSGNETDKNLHLAIYDMDPEYECAAILQEGYPFEKSRLPVISKFDSLDDAILFEGIGHIKAFRLQETGDVVCYAYSLSEFLQAEPN